MTATGVQNLEDVQFRFLGMPHSMATKHYYAVVGI